MKQYMKFWWIGAVAGLFLCAAPAMGQIQILPTPEKVEPLQGTLKYSPGTPVITPSDADLGEEGYELEIRKDGIVIRANGKGGQFYARQSLEQLVQRAGGGNLPCVKITDRPRYAWRGFTLDSGRQYQKVETIKGILDRMAMLKMNVFHWHLTEGDGWRIEIKKYPRLTEVGARVASGAEQQGFYTQDEIRDIVAYAAERNITIVPEIDIPGHSEAALAAYPEYTCFRNPPPSTGDFSDFLYCAGRDSTVEFLTNVLNEVCELFPSEYIHIGGDEAPKGQWNRCPDCQARIRKLGLKNTHELQIDLTNRIARHLAARGRKAICWDDVVALPGPALEDNVVVQWWNWRRDKDKALRESIRRKLRVIANSNYYTYLNFPERQPWKGYAQDRVFDLRTCYERNPSDIRNPTPEERAALLGMGCSLWTDYNLTEDMLDLRMFPRIIALAEQMWSKADRLPFDEFEKRAYAMRDILAARGIGGNWDNQQQSQKTK